MDRVSGIAVLQEHVDEQATLESRLLKPTVKDIKDREKTFSCAVSLLVDLGDEPFDCSTVFAMSEDGEDEFVFRAEVPVEGHFGDARFGDYAVDTDRLDSVIAEEVVGRLKRKTGLSLMIQGGGPLVGVSPKSP